jgi:hypothetical protein
MLDPARLVFIDETAVSTNLVRLRGQAPNESRYLLRVRFQRRHTSSARLRRGTLFLLQRCSNLTAELALISKRSATSRRDAPSISAASITRSRKSPEYDLGIAHTPQKRINVQRLAHP